MIFLVLPLFSKRTLQHPSKRSKCSSLSAYPRYLVLIDLSIFKYTVLTTCDDFLFTIQTALTLFINPRDHKAILSRHTRPTTSRKHHALKYQYFLHAFPTCHFNVRQSPDALSVIPRKSEVPSLGAPPFPHPLHAQAKFLESIR